MLCAKKQGAKQKKAV